jgi:hypothetical protein
LRLDIHVLHIQNILPFRGEGREGQVAKFHPVNMTGFKPTAFGPKSTVSCLLTMGIHCRIQDWNGQVMLCKQMDKEYQRHLYTTTGKSRMRCNMIINAVSGSVNEDTQ